ncbi:hypothetical protein SAMN05660652_02101 [Propionivibrio dicarboxylicus]|uniref:Uncharacterized protein n=1 Tax=Propionivibrio dicarboxylicus TaxID=83767 RepID=A0A1G8EJ66_9RHOO|nr:hypothetical protein SAMN05660652_02101 [Propionivibrio dicarboxylicus]
MPENSCGGDSVVVIDSRHDLSAPLQQIDDHPHDELGFFVRILETLCFSEFIYQPVQAKSLVPPIGGTLLDALLANFGYFPHDRLRDDAPTPPRPSDRNFSVSRRLESLQQLRAYVDVRINPPEMPHDFLKHRFSCFLCLATGVLAREHLVFEQLNVFFFHRFLFGKKRPRCMRLEFPIINQTMRIFGNNNA